MYNQVDIEEFRDEGYQVVIDDNSKKDKEGNVRHS